MCNSRLANAPGIPPSRRTNRGPISFFSSSLDQTIETRIQLEIVIILRHFDVNRTATCSATSVARSVQLGSTQYFNIE